MPANGVCSVLACELRNQNSICDKFLKETCASRAHESDIKDLRHGLCDRRLWKLTLTLRALYFDTARDDSVALRIFILYALMCAIFISTITFIVKMV